MSVFCSAKCASARTGEVVVPVPRGAPMASPPGRSQASHLRVDRVLRATGERVKELGCTSFAAVATAKDGRTAQTVMVGTDARGRPDIAGALLAIVTAVFMDPKRIRKKLAERAGVLKVKAAVEGGAAEIVRDMPAAALPALAVRVSAYLYFALPAHDFNPAIPLSYLFTGCARGAAKGGGDARGAAGASANQAGHRDCRVQWRGGREHVGRDSRHLQH